MNPNVSNLAELQLSSVNNADLITAKSITKSCIMPYLLNSCGYLHKISKKLNVVTNEGNSWNGICHWTKDEIGVAVQNWLRVQVENMA